jgi:cytochrome P450
MTTTADQGSMPSYRTTLDTDPYDFYDRVRREGVVWDEALNSWLVGAHELIRETMRRDKKLVRHATSDLKDEKRNIISGGSRSRLLMHGDDHTRHHRFFVQHFTYAVVDGWRETLLRPIADRILDPVVPHGRIDVQKEYADKFSVRVIAAFMRLPWDDDAWIGHCKALLDRKQNYLDVYYAGLTPEIEQSALEAVEEMNELLLPFLMDAKKREPSDDDILALLWAEGHTIMPDWGIEDMQAWIATTFFAGTDTTTHAVQNAIYLLAKSPELREQVVSGGTEGLERFTEEVLRLYPSVHNIRRIANEDFELGGKLIKKEDRLFMLNPAANRDPSRYSCPHEIDLTRDGWHEHLAFSVGPRTCAGAALARAEIQESAAKFLERLPNMRLDPDAEEPRLRGFLLRSFGPLHLLFDPPG